MARRLSGIQKSPLLFDRSRRMVMLFAAAFCVLVPGFSIGEGRAGEGRHLLADADQRHSTKTVETDKLVPAWVIGQGNDTRLRPGQFLFIDNETAWARVWSAHRGMISNVGLGRRSGIDFARQLILVAVVDQASGTLRWSVQREGATRRVDLEPIGGSEDIRSEGSESGVNYLFLGLPRTGEDTVARFKSLKGESWKQVAAARSGASSKHKGFSSKHETVQPRLSERPLPSGKRLNIVFTHDPGKGNYDGVVGTATDLWNFVSLGTTAKDFLRFSDTSASSARLRFSRHDGAWGIAGHQGIYHGYAYDNCRCKDLQTTILDLEQGRYQAFVYAHGDAAEQNAAIELLVGDVSLGVKATTKDERYRQKKWMDGVQYVRFEFDLKGGEPVRFIARRDGSDYSMFNAIQIVRVKEAAQFDGSGPVGSGSETDQSIQ